MTHDSALGPGLLIALHIDLAQDELVWFRSWLLSPHLPDYWVLQEPSKHPKFLQGKHQIAYFARES